MPNLVVSAGPGTAKTYTVIRAARYLRATNRDVFFKNNPHTQEQLAIWKWADKLNLPKDASIAYMAYNKDAVADVKPDLPSSVECRTIHGHGYSVINRRYGYVPLTNARGMTLVEKITGKRFNNLPDRFKWLTSLRYLEKMKEELLDNVPETYEFLREKYDGLANFPIHKAMDDQIRRLIIKMKEVDRRVGIEYIDQVWLPLFLVKKPIYDLGLVDECQDLSAARLLLARKLCRNLIFVGDENQAINGFSGADYRSFDKINAICEDKLPLKESFRCPPNIVKLANSICPGAKLRTSNEEPGKEIRVPYNDLIKSLPRKPSETLMVCRYNAPLIGCALKLYKAEIPCTILGHQLPNQLASIVTGRRADDLDDLRIKLKTYEENSCQNVPEYVAEAIRDRILCITKVMDEFPDSSVKELPNKIKRFFKPIKSSVTLSTIHKAKGSERPHVFILFPPIESQYATTEDQKKQETNLAFVAVSRTSKNLYWVVR